MRKAVPNIKEKLICCLRALSLAVLIFSFNEYSKAQSTNINFPTPISSNEIRGTINARDIGDRRLTTHYYVFEGIQGDILIRVETANFDGDVDIFNIEGLRPVTKMSFIAGTSLTGIGREIYLRKPEKLILRVEGKSVSDEAASYLIKFEGSFRPSLARSELDEPELPQVKTELDGIKVNAVGTIIETEAENDSKEVSDREADTSARTARTPTNRKTRPDPRKTPDKPVEDSEEIKEDSEETEARRPTNTTAGVSPFPVVSKPRSRPSATPATKTAKPDPLASVRLVVVLKDGETIEHPMNEVLRFGVDRGILTIIMRNGKIMRRPIIEISKITIE